MSFEEIRATTPASKPTRTMGKQLLFLCGTLIFIFVFLEIGLRVYDAFTGAIAQIDKFYMSSNQQGIFNTDMFVHHKYTPNLKYAEIDPDGDDSHIFETNRWGFAKPEFELEKKPGIYRILMVGDSFTAGTLNPFGSSFTDVIRRLFHEKNPSIEVINLGVASYSPLLELCQYRELGHRLKADLVVLNFDMGDLNDDANYVRFARLDANGIPYACEGPTDSYCAEFTTQGLKTEERPSLKPGFASILYRNFFLAKATKHGIYLFHRSRLNYEETGKELTRFGWTLGYEKDDLPQLEKTFGYIRAIDTMVRADGAKFLLATYPYPHQVRADLWDGSLRGFPTRDHFGIEKNKVYLEDAPFRLLRERADAAHITFFNGAPALRQAEGKLYFDNDMHFTAKGHLAYGLALFEKMQEVMAAK